MRTVGLPISHKENERRRALLPVHIGRIQNKGLIYIEEGYGEVLGFADEDYLKVPLIWTKTFTATRTSIWKISTKRVSAVWTKPETPLKKRNIKQTYHTDFF